MNRYWYHSVFIVSIFVYLFLSVASSVSAQSSPVSFTKILIQSSQAPWGKNLADLSGDGQLDIVEGGGGLGTNIYWYQYPSWSKYQIGAVGGDDDLQVGDINKDGAPDVVVNGGTYWYENPRGSGGNVQGLWTRHTIDANNNGHDLVLGDVNGDTRLDVLTRGEFGPTTLYLQGATPDTWTAIPMPNAPNGEGSALADINRDGKVDIVGNGYWLQQPSSGITNGASWIRRDFGSWPAGSSVAVVDINLDGRLDIFLSYSEVGPGTLSWFEAPSDPINGTWIQHDIGNVEDVHRFHLQDMNNDGLLDIAFGEMHQSATDRIGIFYNQGSGASWTLQVLATTGSHNIAVGDVGNDGDLDILTGNWNLSSPDGGSLNLWRNNLDPGSQTLPLDQWTYINADSTRTSQKFGIDGSIDVTGDGYRDIVSGQYFYRNPGGTMTGTWPRTTLPNVNGQSPDALLIVNVDDDSFGDAIVMNANGEVFWLEATTANGSSWINRGMIGDVGSADEGISTQGYVLGQIVAGGKPEIIINVAERLAYFEIPSNPTTVPWQTMKSIRSSAVQEPEGVALGDIDGDGNLDIVSNTNTTSISWWRNPGNGTENWQSFSIGSIPGDFVDRLGLADLDGDGDVDLSVSGANGSGIGIYWFRSPATKTSAWTRTTILSSAQVDTMNSMDVADMDRDGDIDIIAAEHRGSQRLFILENSGTGTFTTRTISTGIENHLGARVFDLDGDGDLDIIGIAWDGYQDLHVWRNDAISGGGTLPTSTPTQTPTPTVPLTPLPTPTIGPLSPYAHWKFDEGNGISITDSSGNNFSGTAININWNSSGRYGQALIFNGSSSLVDVGTIDVPANTSALTLSAWVNASGFLSPSDDNRIIAKSTGTSEQDHIFMLSTIDSNGVVKPRFRLKTNGSTTTLIPSSGNITTQQWTHVTAVYDGTRMILYQDGVEIGNVLKTGIIDTDNTVPVNIGSNPDGYGSWNGSIDDVRIYTKALTPDEIQHVMNNTVPTSISGDVNGDGSVNLTDLSTLLANFGRSGAGIGKEQGDVSGDGSVTLVDLSTLLANFGRS